VCSVHSALQPPCQAACRASQAVSREDMSGRRKQTIVYEVKFSRKFVKLRLQATNLNSSSKSILEQIVRNSNTMLYEGRLIGPM